MAELNSNILVTILKCEQVNFLIQIKDSAYRKNKTSKPNYVRQKTHLNCKHSERLEVNECYYGLNYVPPKIQMFDSKPQFLSMWPYLETRSLQR